MPRFQKGKSGNPQGKKKGTLNKQTKQIKEAFATVMELLEARMMNNEDVINRLSPSRAAELYVNLLAYIKPKLTKNDNSNTLSGDISINVNFTDLSNDSDNMNDNDDVVE